MPLSIIIIEPENPGNTGAIARVMKNFGFKDLILIGPRFDVDSDEVRNRAKWANDLVDSIISHKYTKSSLQNLRKRFDYLIATTAKTGRDYNIPRSPISPEQLGKRISGLSKKTRIGIVFGREGSGLTNNEIAQMDFVVTIPASKDYDTLNLSHSVGIILYEIFKNSGEEHSTTHITPIGYAEKNQLFKLMELSIKRMDFSNEQKRETQRIVWKKMINRSFLSRREAYALMGFFTKIKYDRESHTNKVTIYKQG